MFVKSTGLISVLAYSGHRESIFLVYTAWLGLGDPFNHKIKCLLFCFTDDQAWCYVVCPLTAFVPFYHVLFHLKTKAPPPSRQGKLSVGA